MLIDEWRLFIPRRVGVDGHDPPPNVDHGLDQITEPAFRHRPQLSQVAMAID